MSATITRVVGNSTNEVNSSYGSLTFTAYLDQPAAGPITAQYRVLGGTALPYLDYPQYGVGTVAFATGAESATITVYVSADFLDELDESVVLELFNPTGGATFADNQPSLRGTGVILDDDGAGSNLALFVSDPKIIEGDAGTSQAVFELRLSQPATAPMTFTYSTKDGSAVAGSDYVAKNGSVTFAIGEFSKTVAVGIKGDAVLEPTESFFLTVAPAAGVAGATGMATILDDDAGAGPVISVSGGTLPEITSSYGSLLYTLTLSEASDAPVAVQYRIIGGTALARLDYAQDNVRTVVFAPGQTVQTIEVSATSDALDELDESVVVEFFNPTGGAVFAGGQPSLRSTGVILDDDGAGSNLALFVSDPKVLEGDAGTSQAMFELHLSRPATAAMSFTYKTENGSAVAGSDFAAKAGTVTFAAGQQTAFVSVNVLGNAVAENTETFFLTVTPKTAGVAAATGTATILDDDTGGGVVPVISVAGGVLPEVSSTYGTLLYTVTLSEASDAPVAVQYRIIGGTALARLDYAQDDVRTVVFAPGQTVQTIEVSAASDVLDELDESVVVEFFNPTGGAVFPGNQPSLRSTGVILDDDGAGSNLALFVSDPTIIEGDAGSREALFELRLSQPADATMTFAYSTGNGSAVAGSDYTAKAGTVTFAAGQQTAFVSVNVLGNAAAENNESFFLTVTPTVAGIAGATGMATILDDDTSGGTAPVISVSGGSLTEVSSTYGSLLYTVTLSEPSDGPVSVQYRTIGGTALPGVDYAQVAAGTVSFAAGQTVKTIEIYVQSDGLDERDESIVLEFFNPTGGAVFPREQPSLRATGVILDDDGAGSNLALFVSDPQILEGDAGQTQAVFELRLSRAGDAPVTFDYATANDTALAGSDYVATAGSVTFAPGQQSAFVTVNVIGNGFAEANERFTLTVTPRGAGMPSVTGTATILDDDTGGGVPVISATAGAFAEISSSYAELLYTITLSEASAAPISVGVRTLTTGTATSGVDFYARNTTITFEAGQTSRTVAISAIADAVIEPNETVILELFNPTGGAAFAGGGATLQVTGVILDNDGPHAGTSGNDTMIGTPAEDTLRGADGHDSLMGEGGDDSLVGGSGNDTLVGGAGGDTLDGGLGANVLRGGAGDDFYVLDETPDTIVETANAGIDTVLLTGALAAPAFAMGANIERAFVLGAARNVTGNGLDNLIIGGSANDTLRGGLGDDTLDGGLGTDRLAGGSGDDLYIVNTASDIVTELAGQGNDTVRTTAATLTLQAQVENLEAANGIAHRLTGNGLDNVITGNIGSDTIAGGLGNDTLDGGIGVDRLLGGKGDDFYIVTPGDVVIEGVNQGTDTVFVSFGKAFALAAQVEVLLLGGNQAMNGTGNALGNLIEGNGAANVLYGLAGGDTLSGGGGNDVLIGGLNADTLSGGAGSDQFRFNTVADSAAATPDVILDFTSQAGQGLDRIDLRQMDANPFLNGNQAFSYIGGAAFDGDGAASAGQLRVQAVSAGRYLAEGDLDGNGIAEFAVEIHTAATPTAGWFFL